MPEVTVQVGHLEQHLTARRAAGSALLVPYVTGGIIPGWIDCVKACAAAGADAVEIGLPFSDPMLDGEIIQAASQQALDRGTTPAGILHELSGLDLGIPLIAMTYSNIVMRRGADDFCTRLADSGVCGLIVPDTPIDEVDTLATTTTASDIELILLVAPSTSTVRVRVIAERSRGFVYCVSRMQTTGVRTDLAATAASVAGRVRQCTTRPVLLGFGISTPEQAVRACAHADGVVVASVLMRGLMAGGGPAELEAEVGVLRSAIDGTERP
ncbi:MAG: tryptophan synthase subunit alpha [Pseudonocardiaceae bacterium]